MMGRRVNIGQEQEEVTGQQLERALGLLTTFCSHRRDRARAPVCVAPPRLLPPPPGSSPEERCRSIHPSLPPTRATFLLSEQNDANVLSQSYFRQTRPVTRGT